MSNINNLDVLKLYASTFIQRMLITANHCTYDEVSLPSLHDILSTKNVQFISNLKYVPYTSASFVIEGGEIVSEDRIQYGHLFSKQEFGIMYDGSDSHLIDLLNFSFMMMEKDVSISHAALQSLSLLDRIYKEDTAPDLGTKQFKGVKPYEI